MKAVLLALLVGCTDPEPTPTVGDAVHEIATSTCSRYLACGFSDLRWDQCVETAEEYLCSTFDCLAPYPKFEELLECTEWYAQLSCESSAHLCVLP